MKALREIFIFESSPSDLTLSRPRQGTRGQGTGVRGWKRYLERFTKNQWCFSSPEREFHWSTAGTGKRRIIWRARFSTADHEQQADQVSRAEEAFRRGLVHMEARHKSSVGDFAAVAILPTVCAWQPHQLHFSYVFECPHHPCERSSITPKASRQSVPGRPSLCIACWTFFAMLDLHGIYRQLGSSTHRRTNGTQSLCTFVLIYIPLESIGLF